MISNDLHKYCERIYADTYLREKQKLEKIFSTGKNTGVISLSKKKEIDIYSQKEAIKVTAIESMKHFSGIDIALIWRAVYETHIHRKSGINNHDIISKVISADQSWKKSSGHAFEEMIKILGSTALHNTRVDILLQRDLNLLIKEQKLHNDSRDISWLKEQIKSSAFDLYSIIHTADEKQFCYGCIQCKTSVRDRVTRDREPSIKAMQSFFWSTIIILDGDFLKLPKFISMVNGGTAEYNENGWHGMYVFSDRYSQGRIYSIDSDFKNFKEHSVKAASFWLTQRQWFNNTWRAD